MKYSNTSPRSLSKLAVLRAWSHVNPADLELVGVCTSGESALSVYSINLFARVHAATAVLKHVKTPKNTFG